MLNAEEKAVVDGIIAPYLRDEKVQSMKNFIQHGTITTFDHVLAVVYKSYEVARATHAIGKIDLEAMLRAALLHDFYLYDWHEKDASHKWHGYHHADRALENAREYFGVGELEQSIIYSHMWPLNITRVPKSREAWIVTFADKIVASGETVKGFFRKKKPEKKEREEVLAAKK